MVDNFHSLDSRIDRRKLLKYGAAGSIGVATPGLLSSKIVEGASKQEVTIDVDDPIEESDHNASGFLYGLSYGGKKPSNQWLTPLKPGLFVGGGARLEGGAWAKGGLEGYEKRWEMVKQQYDRISGLPSDPEYVIRISDLWGADAVTVVDEDDPFPGDNGNWKRWEGLLEQIIVDVEKAGMDPDEIQFEIWNEPNYSLFWNRSQEQFRELWRRGVRILRNRYPPARIVGPNYTHLLPDLIDRFEDWLEMTISTETVPDIINWHNLQEWNDPIRDTTTVRSILAEKDLSNIPLEINEYLPQNQLNPGYNAWDMARIEKSDVKYASLGVWTACCDYPELVGLLSRTEDGLKPTGRWWLYEKYGSITGTLLETQKSDGVDSIAGVNSEKNQVEVILGSKGYNGDVRVNVQVAKSGRRFIRGNRIRVVVEKIPDQSVVESPEVIRDHSVWLSDDEFSIPIQWEDATDAYAVTLMPPDSPFNMR